MAVSTQLELLAWEEKNILNVGNSWNEHFRTIATIARIHECVIRDMFVKVHSDMLEAHYGIQLKDTYHASRNGDKTNELKKSANSVALLTLKNPQRAVLFISCAFAAMFGFTVATLENLCDGLQKFRQQRTKLGWKHLRSVHGALKRLSTNERRERDKIITCTCETRTTDVYDFKCLPVVLPSPCRP